MEVEFEAGLSPFIKKIVHMVEDPQTDEIISWSSSGKSFIIWDRHQFSITLLPKYFKHNNFANFHIQLNNYGFNKINQDMCEFGNKWFQKGMKHLLKNIQSKKGKKLQHIGTARTWLKNQEFGTRTEQETSKEKSQDIIDAIDQSKNERGRNPEASASCPSKRRILFSTFLGSKNFKLWDKLLEDDLNICKTNVQIEEFAAHHSKMALELENAIAKSLDDTGHLA